MNHSMNMRLIELGFVLGFHCGIILAYKLPTEFALNITDLVVDPLSSQFMLYLEWLKKNRK